MILTPMAQLIAILDTFRVANLDNAILHSFQNNYVPVLGSNAGNFTESTYPGYAAINLGVWSNAADSGLGYAYTAESLRTWICTGGGGQNIYGWYLTKGGILVCAQRDSTAPYNITPGNTYSVLPEYNTQNI